MKFITWFRNFKIQKGQSIIEALISLAVAVIIVSAITVVVISSVNNSDFGKNQNLASEYARQGIEMMRQKSQSNWNSFNLYAGTYCLAGGSTTLSGPVSSCTTKNINNSSGTPFFVRQVQIVHAISTAPNCPNNIDVTVSVLWADGKCAAGTFCHKVALESCIANLNSKPAP